MYKVDIDTLKRIKTSLSSYKEILETEVIETELGKEHIGYLKSDIEEVGYLISILETEYQIV